MRRAFSDIVDRRFGHLITDRIGHRTGRRIYWSCTCDCGNVTTVRQDDLISGHTRSCGCLQPKSTETRSLRKRRPEEWAWTAEQEEYLRRWYYKKHINELVAHLERSKEAVWMKAINLGLARPFAPRRDVTPEQYAAVVNEVSAEMGVRPALVLGDSRLRKVSRARHEAWARLAADGRGPVGIAAVSGFDHSSISMALKARGRMAAE